MKHIAVLLLLAHVAAFGQSQSGFWRDSSGKPVPESDSMRSANDFAGSVLVTPDEDWEKKWNTPPDTKPNFNRADVIPYGKKVFVLIFFANPKLDATGKADVRCNLKMSAPTGKVTLKQDNVTCFAGRLMGSPYHLRLSAPVIAFSGDPGDPPGTWVVEVLLRDAVRDVALPLRTTFTLR
jgi:hypothetical protein